jgi:hypothetical protein
MLTLSADEQRVRKQRIAEAQRICDHGEFGSKRRTLDLAEDLPNLLVAFLALEIHSHDNRRHLNANSGRDLSSLIQMCISIAKGPENGS